MTPEPVEWVEENIDDLDLNKEPKEYFEKSWDHFSVDTQEQIEQLFEDAREAAIEGLAEQEEMSEEELEEGGLK